MVDVLETGEEPAGDIVPINPDVPTPAEAAAILGDPDLASAPVSVITWLFRLADEPDFGGIGLFADYNAEAGEITLVGPEGESSVFVVLNGGANIVPKEVASAGTAADIARNNLLNMQAAQLQALMSGDLIPLEDGRSIIRGTTTVVDTRTPGQFAPIEGIPGTFYDPVTGSFIDQNGAQIARDRFAFERDFIFPEEQRQFDESLAVDRENIASQDRRSVLSSLVNLQGQRDARGIAGAQAAADPGNFVAAENIRRGLAPPEQGETPLFQDVDFGDTGLADIMALLLGGGQQQGIAEAVAPTSGRFTPEAQAGIAAGAQEAAIANAIAKERALAGLPPVEPRPTEFGGGDPTRTVDGGQITGLTPEQIAAANASNVIPGLAHGGATTAPMFQTGDPVPGSNKPNPELVINPTNAPIQVIKLSDVIKDIPRFFAGTSTGLGTAAAPQDFPELRQDPTAPVARTTQDVDIQQTPGLRFIQGGQGAGEDFNRLSTSTIEGPFGTGLPLAGALNFTRAQEALQDPITGPLLSSLFRAASMNFAGEVERARKRAPTGQSLASTLVRT